MRTIKFEPRLTPLLHPDRDTGCPAKTATWRLGQKYAVSPYSAGEHVLLCGNDGADEAIAVAEVTETFCKPFAELTTQDREGHEKYPDDTAMYETFQSYYPGEKVGPRTPVTVAKLRTLAYIAVYTPTQVTLIEPDFN